MVRALLDAGAEKEAKTKVGGEVSGMTGGGREGTEVSRTGMLCHVCVVPL